MTGHYLTALASIAALLVYFYMGLRVGRARGAHNIVAPATSGHPDFDRAFRIHANTLEWLPLFLVALWLFSFTVSDLWAAIVGVVWIVGRVVYLTSYTKDPATRSAGFGIQALATAVLLFGSLGVIIWNMVQHGVH
jgi:glutathione S-transferase